MNIFNIFQKNIIILCIFLGAISCKIQTEYDLLTGDLIGYVTVHDNQRAEMEDCSGVEITVEGCDPEIKTTTDENGKYIISGLKSGTYNITYNKDGFGQYKLIGYSFIGGNIPTSIYQTNIYELSNVGISNLEIEDIDDFFSIQLRLSATLNNNNGSFKHYFRYYLSTDPEVSYTNYIFSEIKFSMSNDSFLFYLDLDTKRFPPGTELYLILYPTTDHYQYYTDITTGKKIYSSVNTNNPSNIVKFTVPEISTQ